MGLILVRPRENKTKSSFYVLAMIRETTRDKQTYVWNANMPHAACALANSDVFEWVCSTC